MAQALRQPSPVAGLLEISLCIFRPEGQDEGKSRHMGLWFTYAEDPDDKQHAFSHAVSIERVYYSQVRLNYNPLRSKLFLSRARIGHIRSATTPEEIASWTSQVRYDKQDPEMNCQKWIFDILRALKHEELISGGTAEEGENAAIAAIFSAPDYQ